MAAPKRLAIIGAALDLGAGRRGVDMGPSAIRYAGLEARLRRLGREVVDLGNVPAAVPEAIAEESERARYLEEVKATCSVVARLVAEAIGDGDLPLVLAARASDPPGADLALLGDVPAQLVEVLPVDLVDLLLAEVTALPPSHHPGRRGAPPSGRLTSVASGAFASRH